MKKKEITKQDLSQVQTYALIRYIIWNFLQFNSDCVYIVVLYRDRINFIQEFFKIRLFIVIDNPLSEIHFLSKQ